MALIFLAISLFFTPSTRAHMFLSAGACRGCHEEIYDQWSGSMHASSSTDPLFREVFQDLNSKQPSQGKLCLNCHTPAAALLAGSIERGTIESEGVTCGFCHTVTEVRIDGALPRFTNTPGVKRRSREVAAGAHHGIEASPVMLRGELCGGCHNYTNQNGVPIISTYSEWQESFYRGKGIQCQYCHLPELYGDDKYLTTFRSQKSPSNHAMRGGHVPGRMIEAFDVWGTIERSDAGLEVELYLTNKKAGHRMPTGIPSHRIAIVTRIFEGSGVKVAENTVYLERLLGDERGRPLHSPPEIFMQAKKVLHDTRLGPKEKRMVGLQFPLDRDLRDFSATTSLYYEKLGRSIAGSRERIYLGKVEIRDKRSVFFPKALLFLIFIAASCLIVYLVIGKKRVKRSPTY
ncbi:MAG: hypothetical protein GTN70_08025 [Deltaproteobacteria bacterium]|nr:hypothetical protein [Deltaproteobacteria bacterium]NIS77646.1 hypothetical protein [Deltaproteobacteria bacterium]